MSKLRYTVRRRTRLYAEMNDLWDEDEEDWIPEDDEWMEKFREPRRILRMGIPYVGNRRKKRMYARKNIAAVVRLSYDYPNIF